MSDSVAGVPVLVPTVPFSGSAKGEPLHLETAVSVAEYAASRLLQPRLGEPLAVAEGMLVLRVEGRLATRTVGALVSSGQLTFTPLMRRQRGRPTAEPFGSGASAVFQTTGHGLVVVAPGSGRFTALGLQEDILYLRERALFAFEESLLFENGRVPRSGKGGEAFWVVQLRGTGRCVLHTARRTFCVKLGPEETLYVERAVLLGWIGRVVPRQLADASSYFECSGEGALILEEPAEPAAP